MECPLKGFQIGQVILLEGDCGIDKVFDSSTVVQERDHTQAPKSRMSPAKAEQNGFVEALLIHELAARKIGPRSHSQLLHVKCERRSKTEALQMREIFYPDTELIRDNHVIALNLELLELTKSA